MRQAAIYCFVWLASCGLAANGALPEPLHTDEREFAIPFAIESPGLQTSVELHVSDDHGRSWRLQATADATASGFTFHAPHEGEYWFAVRSVDPRRPSNRTTVLEPEMRVIVGHGRTASEVASRLPAALAPVGATTRWVRSSTFEIEYDDRAYATANSSASNADSTTNRAATNSATINTSTINSVELWFTGDGGASWHRYGADADHHSPVRVSTDGEGLYGFRLVIQSTTGPRDRAPEPGDQPEVWVAVDMQPPTARLTTAEVVHTARGDELVVRWDVSDTRLASHPVTLEYSPDRAGPWLALGRDLNEAGPFQCPLVDLSLPSTSMPIYLRLTVRDLAGNVARYTTQEPITLPAPVEASRTARVSPQNNSSLRSGFEVRKGGDSGGSTNSAARGARWLQVLR